MGHEARLAGEQEAIFRGIAENTADLICVVDVDGARVYLSPSHGKLLTSPANALSDPLSDRWLPGVHADDAARVCAACLNVLSTGRGGSFAYRLSGRDGNTAQMDVLATVLREADGKVSGAVFVSRDVSRYCVSESDARAAREREAPRLAAEAAFTESGVRKTAILESAMDCILSCDSEGRVLDFNPAAEKTFGFARADIVGRLLADTIAPPELRHQLPRFLGNGADSLIGRRLEVTAMRADGSRFPVEIAITTFVVNGQAVFTGFLRDVTERKRAEALLRDSEARFRRMVELLPEAICVHRDDRFVMVNAAFARLVNGADADALLGRSIFDFVHQDFHQLFRQRREKLARGETLAPFVEQRWRHVDGTEFDAEVASTTLQFQGAQAFQTVVRDITDRKQVERVLRSLVEGKTLGIGDEFFAALVRGLASALETRYAVVAECRADLPRKAQVLAFWKDDHCVTEDAFDIDNGPCRSLNPDEGLRYYRDHANVHLPGNAWLKSLDASCYLGMPLSDRTKKTIGHLYVLHDRPLRNEERAKTIIGIFAARAAMEMERKRIEEDIRRMAHYDALTGLPNRVLLQDRIGQAIATAHRHGGQMAILYLDLDRFKHINDTLGHEAGDRGLRDIASRLAACMRQSDTIARLGGDEFLVLVSDFTDLKYLSGIARKILDAVAKPFFIDGQECHVTASIGIATYPSEGEDAQQLLKNADIAMYRAKAAGKNNYQFYSVHMNVHTLERLTLESQLARAIEKREFMLHYQPKVNLLSGRIIGIEALLRWPHPQRGMLSPGDFIPLAEETGLIVPLTLWVLETACAQAGAWRRLGIADLPIAVNISARHFVYESLLQDVHRVLQRTNFPPTQLELEITESAVMHSPTQAVGLMQELKARGIRLTIDDFGTGYSSLAHLKRLPIDSVKIDRSFIHGIPDNAGDEAITRAVIAMAHSMRMTVIAEGVENARQAHFLRESGCDQYQGCYFSRPMPVEGIEELLRRETKPLP